ncbi:DUF192 domain-containing protein [Candidatus Woesearchaeota archaeon]|nr:DUF192 domain-containing protein [Candidatus Woesearchaeota archaeon]
MLFTIKNNEKVLLCKNSVFHKTVFSKGTGLMFHKKIFDKAHIFPFDKEKFIPLTNWFVFFPIDVIFLNKKNVIVEIKEMFMPFTNYYPVKKASCVIEMPVNTIKKFKICLGDKMYY